MILFCLFHICFRLSPSCWGLSSAASESAPWRVASELSAQQRAYAASLPKTSAVTIGCLTYCCLSTVSKQAAQSDLWPLTSSRLFPPYDCRSFALFATVLSEPWRWLCTKTPGEQHCDLSHVQSHFLLHSCSICANKHLNTVPNKVSAHYQQMKSQKLLTFKMDLSKQYFISR